MASADTVIGYDLSLPKVLANPAATPRAGRGTAFGDFDNDGDVDMVVNNVHEAPDLFRVESRNAHHWLLLHGRYVCKARRPECWRCPIADLCEFPRKTPEPA